MQWREVPCEQRKEGVAERRGAGRAALPDPQRLRAVHAQPDVVQLQLPLEARLGGEAGLVHRLEHRHVGAIRRDVAEHALPRRIGQAVVPGVDAEVGRPRRLLLDHAPEARLDEVVQLVVERPGDRGRGRAGKLDAPEGAGRHATAPA